jgi:hypothetical protein
MKKLLLLTILMYVVNINAQDTITTKVIIFDEEDMGKYDSSKRLGGKNAIKFNPLLLFNGEIPLYYERAINSYFSAEIAVGMTFRDYLGDIGRYFNDDSERENQKINSHFSYKLALRYYPGGVVLDGLYFSVEYANRNYSQNIDMESTGTDPVTGNFQRFTNNFLEEQFHKEFKLICGGQDHDYSDNFFFEYYVGVGIDKRTVTSVEPDLDDPSGLNNYKLETVEETIPRIYLGIKLGFEF